MNHEVQENVDLPIGQLIRSARQQLHLSQYALADRLAAVSGRPTMGRDRVARWERGRQIPRREWRQWLSAVLQVPPERLDAGAVAARQQNRLGHAVVTTQSPQRQTTRRQQGTPALLPVFRSRVQAGILAATLLNPHRAFSLTELADHAGGSLASVSKEAKLLEDAGILVTRHDGAIRLMRAASGKASLGPLTELIRVTYGVPQIIGEEFGRVAAVGRISLVGCWAERFAGVVGPEPESIQVRLTQRPNATPDLDALNAAAARAQHRLHRPVRFTLVAANRPAGRRAAGARGACPRSETARRSSGSRRSTSPQRRSENPGGPVATSSRGWSPAASSSSSADRRPTPARTSTWRRTTSRRPRTWRRGRPDPRSSWCVMRRT